MDWPQDGGRRARGSLLFAGGRGDFIEKYLEALTHWHERGWNVAGFDWRGQGASRGVASGAVPPGFDLLVDDFEALAADWRVAAPGPHVAIGHSMGGHLLLRALAEGRARFDAVVLVAPMIRVNSGPIPTRLAPLIAAFMSGLGLGARPMWRTPATLQGAGSPRQRRLTSSPERYEDEAWWCAREPGYNLGAPTWNWLRAAYRSAAAFTPERLAAIDTPVLILAAEHDRLVRADAIRRVAAALPHGELEIFAEAAHEILREADPVRLEALARIDAFLDDTAR
jgi:lysophospholipase